MSWLRKVFIKVSNLFREEKVFIKDSNLSREEKEKKKEIERRVKELCKANKRNDMDGLRKGLQDEDDGVKDLAIFYLTYKVDKKVLQLLFEVINQQNEGTPIQKKICDLLFGRIFGPGPLKQSWQLDQFLVQEILSKIEDNNSAPKWLCLHILICDHLRSTIYSGRELNYSEVERVSILLRTVLAN